MADFILAADLGQVRDFTAVVVVERLVEDTGKTKRRDLLPPLMINGQFPPGYKPAYVPVYRNHYQVRHIERLPIGTSYPKQAERVKELEQELKQRGSRPALVVDATGVGRPVVDMMREAGLKPIAVTITGGDMVSHEGDSYRVPKRDLVSTVQVLLALDTQRLKIAPGLPEAKTLIDELLAFKVSISLRGHDAYGNDVGLWRENAHDDLVLAVALACWWGENRPYGATAAERLMTMEVMKRMKGRE